MEQNKDADLSPWNYSHLIFFYKDAKNPSWRKDYIQQCYWEKLDDYM